MDPDLPEAMRRYLAEQDDQPFGNTYSVSGRTLQPFSQGLSAAADNLLAKALRALEADDVAKARTYVDRAVALPYDRHGEVQPAAEAACMVLFNLVSDVLEESYEGDAGWVDAAATAAASAGRPGLVELGSTLRVIGQEYDLSRRERSALRALTARLPDDVELRDQSLEPGELADAVLSILAVCREYVAALEAQDG